MITKMNKYANLARDYDRQFRPMAYRQNGRDYYVELGKQIQALVLSLEVSLAGPDPKGEEYLDKVGRLSNARMLAEEKILDEMVYCNLPEDDLGEMWADTPWSNRDVLAVWEQVGVPRVHPATLIGTTWWEYPDEATDSDKMCVELDQLEWYQRMDWSPQHLKWKEQFLAGARRRVADSERLSHPQHLEAAAFLKIYLDTQVIDDHKDNYTKTALRILRHCEQVAGLEPVQFEFLAPYPDLAELAVV